MYKDLIKECLLDKQSRVYSLITKSYGDKLVELRPTLFRKWLSKEIDITEDHINISSLNSALMRLKKSRDGKNKKGIKQDTEINRPQPLQIPFTDDDFVFSTVEINAKNSRTTEL